MQTVREIVITLVIAVIVFFALHTLLESREVHNVSMLPTVEPGERIIVSKAAYFFKDPQRGDIIVFHSDRGKQVDLIKRVIGLPGDTIEVSSRTVFLNGKPLDEPYINEKPTYTLASYQIPEGEYFVLGDNRNLSSDSHAGWTIPRDAIIGKVWFTYWPPRDWHMAKHYAVGG